MPRGSKRNPPRLERLRLLQFAGMALFLFLWLRIVYLQTVVKAEMEQFFFPRGSEQIVRERGTIYDRNGEVLAISNPVFSLYADPEKVLKTDLDSLPAKLSELLGLREKTLVEKLSSKGRFVWIKRNITDEQATAVRKLAHPALGLKKEHYRYYPRGTRAAHILGFVGLDNRGLEGIELEYDGILKGVPDSQGQDIPGEFSSGSIYDIYLTIDNTIQGIAEQELDQAIRDHSAREGVVIVSDPFTGEILALAVSPRYDPNHFQDYPSSARRNRAVTDVFEPGSIMKIFSMGFALKEGLVSEDEVFYCPGFIRRGGHTITCSHAHHNVRIEDILKKSCNVGAIQVSDRFQNDRYYDYLEGLGFGKPMSGIIGERSGILRRPEFWSGLSRASMSIGYEISVTPLQLAQAAAVMANGGILYRPQVTRKIVERESGAIAFVSQPDIVRQVVSSDISRKISDMLREVVTSEGTGYLAKVPGFPAAGKTGTAKRIIDGEYAENRYNAGFVGWVPATDPILEILVVIKDPRKNGYYGGVVSGPVFSRIAGKALSYLKVYSQETGMVLSPPQNRDRPVNLVLDPNPATKPSSVRKTMPDLRGLSLREAVDASRGISSKIRVTGSGKVVRQYPLPGESLTGNNPVRIELGY